jgi:LEA14-like dessication related protein
MTWKGFFMEDGHRPVFAAAVAALGLFLLVGCAGLFKPIDTPRLSVVDLQLVAATIFEQQYRIQLRIQNPNTFALSVDGLQYAVEINNQPFASGVSNRSVVIPALDTAVFEVEATSTLMSFFRQITTLQQGKLETISYRLYGKIHLVGFRGQSFDYKGEMLLGKPPQ